MIDKPICDISNVNGSLLQLVTAARITLEKHELYFEAADMYLRMLDCNDYEDAVEIISHYVDLHYE